MDEKTFKARTKKLAVAIIKQMDKLPKSRAADVVANQSYFREHLLERIIARRVGQSQRQI